MIRTSPFRILAVVAVCLALTSCATYTANTTPAPQRSALEQAKLNYVTGSLDYDFALKVVREAHSANLIPPAQWSRVEQAVKIAQEWAPLVDSMLKAWETYGAKPKDFDAAAGKLATAFAEVGQIKESVK